MIFIRWPLSEFNIPIAAFNSLKGVTWLISGVRHQGLISCSCAFFSAHVRKCQTILFGNWPRSEESLASSLGASAPSSRGVPTKETEAPRIQGAFWHLTRIGVRGLVSRPLGARQVLHPRLRSIRNLPCSDDEPLRCRAHETEGITGHKGQSRPVD